MLLCCACSFYLAIQNNKQFLFSIGMFSLYLVTTGKMILYIKITMIKWGYLGICIVSALFSLLLLYLGIKNLFNGNDFGWVVAFFGILSQLLLYQDFKLFLQLHKKKYFEYKKIMRTHIIKMVAAYISSVTAFLVVNNTFLPSWLLWILPTILGTFYIVIQLRKNVKRLGY